MRSTRFFVSFLILISVLLSCRYPNYTVINGSVDYVGSSTFYVDEKPIHYKYTDKIRHPLNPDSKGQFNLELQTDTQKVVFLTIDDDRYPLVISPGSNLEITIRRSHFPDSVDIDEYDHPWDEYFSSYWREEQKNQNAIDNELTDFKNAKENDLLDLYKNRYLIAKRYFGNTPLDIYYYKNIGEYLVKRLENIKYRRGQNGFDPEAERQKVIQKAKDLDFFTLKSLLSQRAGIRDFTNAYANTFGIADSLEKKYGQSLMQYDVKRLGYDRMNKARVSVLSHIDSRKALAHAKMYLIAERIGEMSPNIAKPSYQSYLENFDDFPRYISFLKNFYNQVKQVTPGQPAVPFTLPDQEGNPVNMKDFRGRYVLLDFWASWCIPCLDEFSHMRDLYQSYSRDEFEIVAISIEEDSLRWRQSINRFENPWPQLYGGNSFEQETFQAYQGGGIPFYILVNPEGNIERHNDIRPSFNLPQLLDSLISEDNSF